MTADGVALASWWWRALAAVIDYMIISAIVGIITFPIWQSLYGAWTAYFNGVLEAQRQGVAPPTVSLTGPDLWHQSADLDRRDARRRDAVSHWLFEVEVRRTRQADLRPSRGAG
jgi:hypothetical protein